MSKESLVPPIAFATVCLAGSLAMGAVARGQFEQANQIEAVRDSVAAEMANRQNPNPNYAPVPGDATDAELEALYNDNNGAAFGRNALAWGATAVSVVLAGCVVGNGVRIGSVVSVRRREDENPGQTPRPKPEQ